VVVRDALVPDAARRQQGRLRVDIRLDSGTTAQLDHRLRAGRDDVLDDRRRDRCPDAPLVDRDVADLVRELVEVLRADDTDRVLGPGLDGIGELGLEPDDYGRRDVR
jgi:hypothetical protein